MFEGHKKARKFKNNLNRIKAIKKRKKRRKPRDMDGGEQRKRKEMTHGIKTTTLC